MLELGNGHVCLNHKCKNYLGACRQVKSGSAMRRITAFTIFSIYLLFSFDDFSMETNQRMEPVYKVEKATVCNPLNVSNLEKELKKNEVICPKEVKAQILLESGNLNSFLLKKTNNMLGMRYPFSRETKAVGLYLPAKDTIIYGNQQELKKYRSANHYAVFEKWEDAIEDYKLWQVSNFRLAEKYLSFLGNVYAEDPAYVSKIRQMASKEQ